MKQIVGSTLRDSEQDGSTLLTNFETDKSAADYANLYKQDGLAGGHAIMLGADPLSVVAALEALHAYPGLVLFYFIIIIILPYHAWYNYIDDIVPLGWSMLVLFISSVMLDVVSTFAYL